MNGEGPHVTTKCMCHFHGGREHRAKIPDKSPDFFCMIYKLQQTWIETSVDIQ